MAYSYDEAQGTPQPAHLGSQSDAPMQMAGDVLNASGIFRNIQNSVGISRSLGGLAPKGDDKIKPKVIPTPTNPMSYDK